MPTIISDPVHGFIEIEEGLPEKLVNHPYLLRLGHIKQLGPTYYVYPGARHTRFEHSLGAYHLVHKAVDSLRKKGIEINQADTQSVEAAMLLHDAGHGPLSHTLENSLVFGICHEDISLQIMKKLNKEFGGTLDGAIQIFTNQHPRIFLSEMIHSQLDMDRMDYLCRDSFFAGVREGSIGAERIVNMLNVRNNQLVVEWKGTYTIENYLMARRLMYWQVYLHKTVIAAKEMVTKALQRARWLIENKKEVEATTPLRYFLENRVDREFIANHPEWIDMFLQLDDSDLEVSLKQWTQCKDKVLSTLAKSFINRNLYKVEEHKKLIEQSELNQLKENLAKVMGISTEEASYFVISKKAQQMLYTTADEHILSLSKDGKVEDMSEISELLHSEMADKTFQRYFLFTQRLNRDYALNH